MHESMPRTHRTWPTSSVHEMAAGVEFTIPPGGGMCSAPRPTPRRH